MEKNLPIKLFKKRENDKALNNLAAIPENTNQKFRLQGDALTARANYFRKYFGGLRSRVLEKRATNNYLPTVVKLKLNENALAKTHRGEVGKIFNKGRKINIIGMVGEDQLLVKIEDEKDLELIESRITDTARNVVGISAIEEAFDFTAEVAVEGEERTTLKVKLINYGDYRLNQIAEMNFQNLCKELNLKCERLNYSKDLILYRIPSLRKEQLNMLTDDNGVFSIKPMPVFSLTKNDLTTKTAVKVKVPEEGIDYFRVGVFDEGISDIEHLKKWKHGSYVAFGVDEYDNEHGTFIAGILNYGDELEGKDWTGTKPFRITEAVIFPNDKYGLIDEVMMTEFMREAIRQHPEVKVWNFSVGNENPVQDDQYSDFARYLDELQSDYNVLIVKAAGNCYNFLKGAPVGRITEASESIRTLVVGSLAHDKRDHDLAAFNNPSPFSMVGPGAGDVIKPDLVHYGGNVGLKGGKPDINGVKSFAANGNLCFAVGTSYSAPRVAALAAELTGSLKEEFNPDLIKALLIHSARHPQEFDQDFMDRLQQIGFGLPTKVGDILFNDPDEVTLILMDAVDKGSNIKIMDFPFPQSLVENDEFYGQVKVTLVTSPEINSQHGAEYVQSDVDVSFGTYGRKVEVLDNKIKRNPIDMEEKENLLVPSKYSTRRQKAAAASFKCERFLHSYSSGRTEMLMPIKKWCIDLEELRDSYKKNALGKDRLWYLQLEAAYRNNYDIRIKDAKDISQEFVLIITIRDTKKKGKVYDEVTNLLTQYNFLHENIKVDQRIILKP